MEIRDVYKSTGHTKDDNCGELKWDEKFRCVAYVPLPYEQKENICNQVKKAQEQNCTIIINNHIIGAEYTILPQQTCEFVVDEKKSEFYIKFPFATFDFVAFNENKLVKIDVR